MQQRTAFSLVELSIVLVILGLLVGGILAGQSLIRASESRAQIAQITEMNTAVTAFRDKYFALPGDMANAASFWPGTVSGNGNGVLDGANGDRGNWNTSETQRFFEQLSLSGLIAGTYKAGGTLVTGFPALKYNSGTGMFAGGAVLLYGNEIDGIISTVQPLKSTWLWLEICALSAYPNAQNMNECAIFRGEDLWNMDKKMDDGMPYSGQLLGFSSWTSGVTPACVTSNNYTLTTSNAICLAAFKLRDN